MFLTLLGASWTMKSAIAVEPRESFLGQNNIPDSEIRNLLNNNIYGTPKVYIYIYALLIICIIQQRVRQETKTHSQNSLRACQQTEKTERKKPEIGLFLQSSSIRELEVPRWLVTIIFLYPLGRTTYELV
ncbi:unnamed protein product [Litomosoides sigmodontis]|uniref:Uncharacterized protein n=1 Tax=Litomosoides sigmodontis TaxID=42156 RepID=A0A3P6UYE5_LITSI|nr:unnamed protein product [Litomosoides sigmodontis]